MLRQISEKSKKCQQFLILSLYFYLFLKLEKKRNLLPILIMMKGQFMLSYMMAIVIFTIVNVMIVVHSLKIIMMMSVRKRKRNLPRSVVKRNLKKDMRIETLLSVLWDNLLISMIVLYHTLPLVSISPQNHQTHLLNLVRLNQSQHHYLVINKP